MSDSVYPVIFVLDDDPKVAGALRDDLAGGSARISA